MSELINNMSLNENDSKNDDIEGVDENNHENDLNIPIINNNNENMNFHDRPDTPEEDRKGPANRLVIPSDVATIDENDEYIYIVGTKDGKVTKIDGLQNMTKLKELVLRCCLISSMEGIENLSQLEKLELYDNQLERISHIENFKTLTILDISFNSIRDMSPVRNCPMLIELYIAQNKLRKIEGLEDMKYLKTLDLGANRIREMTGLENLTSLKSLWLGKNKIERISCVSQMTQLKQLDVQSNRLMFLEGIETLPCLEELYLAHNRIQILGVKDENSVFTSSLPSSPTLHTLDLSSNGVKSVQGIEIQSNLEELWMSSSNLTSFIELEPLKSLTKLNCLYLEHAPLSRNPEYRSTIHATFPHIQELDGVDASKIDLPQPPGLDMNSKLKAAMVAAAQNNGVLKTGTTKTATVMTTNK